MAISNLESQFNNQKTWLFLSWFRKILLSFLFACVRFIKNTLIFCYRSEWQAKVVFLCAFAMMIFVQTVQPLYLGGGDPYDYINTARYLLGYPDGIYSPWRTPGMALFHIISGTVIFDTWKLFIVLFAAMSVAIPLSIYYSISWLSRYFALLAGLISIVSMVPYAYSNVVTSDHLFYFLNYLSICLAVRFFYKPSSRLLCFIPFLICLLNLTRPTAALYYWIFFVFAVFYTYRHHKDLFLQTILSGLIYICLMSGWALFDRAVGATAFETSYPAKTQLDRRFSEIYTRVHDNTLHFVEGIELQPVFKIGKGQASLQLYQALLWYITTYPERWQTTNDMNMPYELFGKFKDKPDRLFHAILTKPNFAYFNFLRTALQAKFGSNYPSFMTRLMSEYGNVGLNGVMNYFIQNPMKMFLGSTPPMSGRNLLGIFYFAPLRSAQHMNRLFGYQEPIPFFFVEPSRPYATEFKNATKFLIRNFPCYWENTNAWYSRFKGNPDQFIQEIFKPSKPPQEMGIWEGCYWELLLKYYGINFADKLFKNVALECLQQYPATAYLFWENILNIMLKFPVCNLDAWNADIMLNSVGDLFSAERSNYLIGLTPGLKNELQDKIVVKDNEVAKLIHYGYAFMHAISPLFVVLTFLLLPFSFLIRKLRYVSCFVLGIYLYNVLGLAVFANFCCARYKDAIILFPIMLTCLGAYSLFRRINNSNDTL